MFCKVLECDQGGEARKMPWLEILNIGKSTTHRINGLFQSMSSSRGDVELLAARSLKKNRDELKALIDAYKIDGNHTK